MNGEVVKKIIRAQLKVDEKDCSRDALQTAHCAHRNKQLLKHRPITRNTSKYIYNIGAFKSCNE